MFLKFVLLLISELILVNGTVTRLYFNEGDVGVIIPCRIDMEILRENGVHVSWLFQRMNYQTGGWVGDEQIITDNGLIFI